MGDDKLIESSVCAEYVAEAFAQVGISLYVTINQAVTKAERALIWLLVAQNGSPLIPEDPLRKARMRLLSELFSTTIQNYWPLLLVGACQSH